MKRWRYPLLLVLLLLLVVSGRGLARARFAGWVSPTLDDLAPLPLAGHQRLLVLAPHNDDETLGVAGLILAARRQGMEVRVAIATNGDGYLFATMEDFRRVFPHSADFIRMGDIRQQESLNALRVLGVPADHVSFLSYPDRSLPALWEDDWRVETPYRSPYTKASQSPYAITYDPKAVYAGEDLLADLQSIIESYHPDLIVYPHPNEVHPDHWGLSIFTHLALALIQQDDPDYQPDAFVYLIHQPDYPQPKGYYPQDCLLPPPSLFTLSPRWFYLDMSEADTQRKQEALAEYKTQLPVLGKFMESFVRHNELFAQVQSATLPHLAKGDTLDPDTWRDRDGRAIEPIQKDPIGDTFVRQVIADSDLVALYASQQPDQTLRLCAEVRHKIEPAMKLNYILRVKAVGPTGVIDYIAGRGRRKDRLTSVKISGRYFCDQISLSELGQPELIVVSAEVRGLEVDLIDQLAWQVVHLE